MKKLMRIFFILICSLALAFAAVGAPKKNKKSHKSDTKKKHLVVAKGHGKGKPYKAQKFKLQTKARPRHIQSVKFEQNRRLAGSEWWAGPNYYVFRNYRPVWHERNWWNSHYDRVVFAYGGWYYWNAGWWYPAWGYAPNAFYAYDGPIYAYNDLPPDRLSPTSRARCNSRDIIGALLTACSGLLRVRQSQLTNATTGFTSRRRSINQRSNRWE